MSCIDHLVLALGNMARRAFPSVVKKDRDNRTRIVEIPVSFTTLVDTTFNQIRQYGRSHAAVTIHLLDGIKRIIPFTRLAEQRAALLRQAAMINRGCLEGLPEPEDQQEVHARYLEIYGILEEKFGLAGGLE